MQLPPTHISVHNGVIEVKVGRSQTTVAVDELELHLRVLNEVKGMLEAAGALTATAVQVLPAAAERAPVEPVPAVPQTDLAGTTATLSTTGRGTKTSWSRWANVAAEEVERAQRFLLDVDVVVAKPAAADVETASVIKDAATNPANRGKAQRAPKEASQPKKRRTGRWTNVPVEESERAQEFPIDVDVLPALRTGAGLRSERQCRMRESRGNRRR